MKTVNFYRQEDPYAYFSNFWPAPIALEGQT